MLRMSTKLIILFFHMAISNFFFHSWFLFFCKQKSIRNLYFFELKVHYRIPSVSCKSANKSFRYVQSVAGIRKKKVDRIQFAIVFQYKTIPNDSDEKKRRKKIALVYGWFHKICTIFVRSNLFYLFFFNCLFIHLYMLSFIFIQLQTLVPIYKIFSFFYMCASIPLANDVRIINVFIE